jgi:hypothetical protein
MIAAGGHLHGGAKDMWLAQPRAEAGGWSRPRRVRPAGPPLLPGAADPARARPDRDRILPVAHRHSRAPRRDADRHRHLRQRPTTPPRDVDHACLRGDRASCRAPLPTAPPRRAHDVPVSARHALLDGLDAPAGAQLEPLAHSCEIEPRALAGECHGSTGRPSRMRSSTQRVERPSSPASRLFVSSGRVGIGRRTTIAGSGCRSSTSPKRRSARRRPHHVRTEPRPQPSSTDVRILEPTGVLNGAQRVARPASPGACRCRILCRMGASESGGFPQQDHAAPATY